MNKRQKKKNQKKRWNRYFKSFSINKKRPKRVTLIITEPDGEPIKLYSIKLGNTVVSPLSWES